MILSGSIGFEIANLSPQINSSLDVFEKKIDEKIKEKKWEYLLVIILIIIGGILEAI